MTEFMKSFDSHLPNLKIDTFKATIQLHYTGRLFGFCVNEKEALDENLTCNKRQRGEKMIVNGFQFSRFYFKNLIWKTTTSNTEFKDVKLKSTLNIAEGHSWHCEQN